MNIAITGGQGTGKSTLAAALFLALKTLGYDYDMITEEARHLKKEMGSPRSPFERLYLWRQQERQELRSSAEYGFITDSPLFVQYVRARRYATEARDKLAVRELFRMVLETEDRYQLIVLPENEIPFKNDTVRTCTAEEAQETHRLIRSFLEHFCSDKLLFVSGTTEQRVEQVVARVKELTTLKSEVRYPFPCSACSDGDTKMEFHSHDPFDATKKFRQKILLLTVALRHVLLRVGAFKPKEPVEDEELITIAKAFVEGRSVERRYEVVLPGGPARLALFARDGVDLDRLLGEPVGPNTGLAKRYQPNQVMIRLLKHF